MKHIVFFLTAALLLNASCGSSDEGGKTDPPAAPVPVAPTTELGKADEAIENLQLKPGKLISINQVNAANCRRAVAAGMCIDIMASDKIVFASDMTDERLDGLFAECGEAIRSTKADFWGLHLPYQTYDISSTNENTRVTAVLKLKRLIELTIEHLRPQHFVIHPNTGTILTTGGDFAERTAQSRKSLAELQRHIESCNAQHGTKAILCVENCARSLAYDGDSLLDLLDAEGLEKVRVCLDTGHALIPLNGKYIDPVCNGDALDVLRRIGTRLGTLHIQQNPGALDPTDPKDKHLEPFSGGLIDWRILLRTAQKQPLPRLLPLRSLLQTGLRRRRLDDRERQKQLHEPDLPGIRPHRRSQKVTAAGESKTAAGDVGCVARCHSSCQSVNDRTKEHDTLPFRVMN